MGCTHTSRLDASARVSFNAVLSKKKKKHLLCQIHDCVSERGPLQHNHSRWETQVLMLFTAPSVWETLLDCQLACLPACSTALGVWAPLSNWLLSSSMLVFAEGYWDDLYLLYLFLNLQNFSKDSQSGMSIILYIYHNAILGPLLQTCKCRVQSSSTVIYVWVRLLSLFALHWTFSFFRSLRAMPPRTPSPAPPSASLPRPTTPSPTTPSCRKVREQIS